MLRHILSVRESFQRRPGGPPRRGFWTALRRAWAAAGSSVRASSWESRATPVAIYMADQYRIASAALSHRVNGILRVTYFASSCGVLCHL